MKKYILILIAFVLISCAKTKSIILKTENADGISNETKLKVNGVEVGKIKNIELDENGEVLIIAILRSELNLPIDSDFKIENEGLIGGKIINIKIGKSKKSLNDKNIVNLKSENLYFFNDSIQIRMDKVINQISGRDKNDSILKELRRLNENLEKMQPNSE